MRVGLIRACFGGIHHPLLSVSHCTFSSDDVRVVSVSDFCVAWGRRGIVLAMEF